MLRIWKQGHIIERYGTSATDNWRPVTDTYFVKYTQYAYIQLRKIQQIVSLCHIFSSPFLGLFLGEFGATFIFTDNGEITEDLQNG